MTFSCGPNGKPRLRVESRSGAVDVGPALTVPDPFGCRCLNICPCLRFQIPLIKLGGQISCTQLSDKVSYAFAHGRLAVDPAKQNSPKVCFRY